jgi:hypothetical protein
MLIGCQNWDLKRPAESTTGADGFTRIGEDPTRLTNDVAIRRVEGIGAAQGQERLDLIEEFLSDFPQARFIPAVHRLAGEAKLAENRPAEAADDFERALVLTRTDVLGMPLETEIPYQLAMAKLTAGDTDAGLSWLVRTSVVDDSPRVDQALRWAWGEAGSSLDFEVWLAELRDPLLVRAPSFSLPGLLQSQVDLESSLGGATIINFWSPT